MFSPLLIKIHPSLLGKWTTVGLVSIAYIGMSASALSSPVLYSLAGVMLTLLFWSWPRFVSLSHPQAITALHWQIRHKNIDVQLRNGDWLKVDALTGRSIGPALLAVELHTEQGTTPLKLLIWRDSVSPESFRRLKVALRFAPPPVRVS